MSGERTRLGSTPGVIASNLRWVRKNTPQASCDLTIPAWRARLKGCLWHRNGDREWIAFGAQQYADLFEFTDRNVHARFQAAALAAVHALATATAGEPVA